VEDAPQRFHLSLPAEKLYLEPRRVGSEDYNWHYAPARIGDLHLATPGVVYLENLRLVPVGMSAEGPITAVSGPAAALPGSFRLEQNVPNPFNATTTIRYTLAQAQPVELWLFNLAGQRVRRLAGGRQAAGEHQVTWDGRDEAGRPVATGIYFYRLEGTPTATRKLLLLR
jgi:hypothetical protein